MNVLRCRKTDIRNPPLVVLAILVSAIVTVGTTMLLQFLNSYSLDKSCKASTVFIMLIESVNKFIVFVYFTEVIHAVRACPNCAFEMCNWFQRVKVDYVWTVLVTFTFVGFLGQAVHTTLRTGLSQYEPEHGCVMRENEILVAHIALFNIIFGVILALAFLTVGMCTIAHYPRLNDVGRRHYQFRMAVVKVLPRSLFRSRHTNDDSAEIAMSCPAYLVPLNGKTAGRSERSAFCSAITIFLCCFPTLINMVVLWGQKGESTAWVRFLLTNLDGMLLFT